MADNSDPEQATQGDQGEGRSWGKWAMSGVSSAASWAKKKIGWQSLQEDRVGEGAPAASAPARDAKESESLWSKLSSLVGKDVVSLISLPVSLFEPTTFLCLMGAPLEFHDLLDRAASPAEAPQDRLSYLAAWLCAVYCDNLRSKKPFNPILGETFELLPRDGSFRMLCEQVSHHPPISASVARAASGAWELVDETHLRSKFAGNSSEFFLEGYHHLRCRETGDHFTWTFPTSSCHNIIVGRMWMDHFGEMKVVNHTTGDFARVQFVKAGWTVASMYNLTGEVCDSKGAVQYKIGGKFTEQMYVVKADPETGEAAQGAVPKVVWKRPERQCDPKWGFNQYFRDELLALSPEYEATLPTTDVRVRSDRRLLEQGDSSAAGKEKTKLEEKQRGEEKARKAKGEEWVPRYFKQVPDDKFGHLWVPQDDLYWKEREQRIASSKASASDK